jgi:furin
VSSRFGFGLMDAGLMTWIASGWRNVPPMSTCESATAHPKRQISARSEQTFPLDVYDCRQTAEPQREVNYIEQVQVYVTLTADRRGEMEIYLYSPSNTRTQLLPVSNRSERIRFSS